MAIALKHNIVAISWYVAQFLFQIAFCRDSKITSSNNESLYIVSSQKFEGVVRPLLLFQWHKNMYSQNNQWVLLGSCSCLPLQDYSKEHSSKSVRFRKISGPEIQKFIESHRITVDLLQRKLPTFLLAFPDNCSFSFLFSILNACTSFQLMLILRGQLCVP